MLLKSILIGVSLTIGINCIAYVVSTGGQPIFSFVGGVFVGIASGVICYWK